jgi:FkbM family methyltransferase
MIRVHRIMDHSFIASAISSSSVVIDLGGNRGTFANGIVEQFGARCVVYEPNPAMFACIPVLPNLEKHQKAATAADGPVSFYVDENPEASSLTADPARVRSDRLLVEGRSLSSIIADADVPRLSLLKIDIEGAEVAVLDATNDDVLSRCDQISIEFHELFGWTSVEDIQRLRKRMRLMGFRSIVMSARHYGDVLFINEAAFGSANTREMLAACRWFRTQRVARACINAVMHRVGLQR